MNFFQNIKLENYRNFNHYQGLILHLVVIFLFGKNGSGKTNILESISLFEKGRGLRKDNINNLVNNNNDQNNFSISPLFFYMIKKKLNYVYSINIKTVTDHKKNYLLTIVLQAIQLNILKIYFH